MDMLLDPDVHMATITGKHDSEKNLLACAASLHARLKGNTIK